MISEVSISRCDFSIDLSGIALKISAVSYGLLYFDCGGDTCVEAMTHGMGRLLEDIAADIRTINDNLYAVKKEEQ